MSLLNPTPPELLVDASGRPYFLWDMDMTLEDFRHRLRVGTADERAYLVGKLMRQAKPDDAFAFVSLDEIRELFPQLARFSAIGCASGSGSSMRGRTSVPPRGLTALQERVLAVLAGLEPPWTLTGGGALVGMHGVQRTTRDLDLFFHGQEQLGDLPDEAARRLRSEGLDVAALQSSVAFRSFRVSDGSETVVVDLVADPVPNIEGPDRVEWEGVVILVDTPHEILVNKLCSLLHRSELRDLSDVKDLIESGGDLERALADAPRKDGGFSPLTLAWLLRGLAVDALGRVAGLDPASILRLNAFRDELGARLTALTKPS